MRPAEQYREWIRQHRRAPAERVASALAVVDAFEICQRKKPLPVKDLKPLVDGAGSTHKLISEPACNLLFLLARRRKEAQQSLLQMASDKRNPTARFHAVAYLDDEIPESLRLAIVQTALVDRANKVKRDAIDKAERFRFKQLLPKLEQMQKTETDEDVQRSLAFHIPILRDGFLLKPAQDGTGYDLILRGPGGCIGGPFIPKKEYSAKRVRELVVQYQAGA